MATNFPTSLDSIPNPSGADLVENATGALDHHNQHANANDAIEALQAKVGANSSADTASHDYKINIAIPAAIAAAAYFTRASGAVYPTTTTDDLVVGTASPEYVTGTELKMFFDQSKGAFRAGGVSGTQWNDANRGSQSAAFGLNNTVLGNWSLAAGASCSAAGAYSIVVGSQSSAAGSYSSAFGNNSTAAGTSSHAVGAQANASRHGQSSHSSSLYMGSGKAQANQFSASKITTNATPDILSFDGAASVVLTGEGTNVLTLPVNKAHRFTINLIARRTDSTSDVGGWTFRGTINRGPSGNAAFVSTPSVESDLTAGAISGLWDCALSVNTSNGTNNYLVITVTGQSGATINWVADIQTVEAG